MFSLFSDPRSGRLATLAIHVGPQVALVLMLGIELLRRRLAAEMRARDAPRRRTRRCATSSGG